MVVVLQVVSVVVAGIGVMCLAGWASSDEPAANVLALMSAASCFWGAIVTYWMAAVLLNLQGLRKSFDTTGESMNAVAKWLKQILAEVAEPPAPKKPQVRVCIECGCPLGRDEAVCPNCRADQRPDLQRADDDAMQYLNVS